MLFSEMAVGDTAAVSKTFTGADINAFIELTGDANPLHLEGPYAAESRFGGRITHGMLTAGLLSTLLGMHLPGTGALYMEQSLRFTAPVRPGDTITARAKVLELIPARMQVRIRTVCVNQRNETVLEGEARMRMLA
ncbi:MAG: MaoC family dehydratase [Gemmatimonadota bacterium]